MVAVLPEGARELLVYLIPLYNPRNKHQNVNKTYPGMDKCTQELEALGLSFLSQTPLKSCPE